MELDGLNVKQNADLRHCNSNFLTQQKLAGKMDFETHYTILQTSDSSQLCMFLEWSLDALGNEVATLCYEHNS